MTMDAVDLERDQSVVGSQSFVPKGVYHVHTELAY